MIANSGLQHSAFEILQGSALCALTASERCRLQNYTILFPRQAMICDVGQIPFQRALLSNRDGDIHTLIRNMGLMVMTDAAPPLGTFRWMLLSELMEASGFPFSHEASQASEVQCSFSRGIPSNPRRTRRSLTEQLGNGIHINATGAYSFLIALLLLHLGRQSTVARHEDARSEDGAGPNVEPEDSSMASSSFAFDRRKKRKYSDKHAELFRQRQSQLSQSILADGQMVQTFWRSLVVPQKACVISP